MPAPSVTLYLARPTSSDDAALGEVEDERLRALTLVSSIEHVVERVRSGAASPSGTTPCAEIDGDVDGDGSNAVVSERIAGRRAREAIRVRVMDCDRDASADERVAIAGVTALCDGNLRVAGEYFSCVDVEGYRAYKAEVARAVPFPMSAWRARRRASEVGRELERAGVDGERACALAVEAYSTLNTMVVNSEMRAKEGEAYWLCGSKPRSCDAAAYAMLNHHARSKSCDALRTEMKRFPRLIQYLNDVTERLSLMEKTLVRRADGVEPSSGAFVDSTSWGDRYDASHAERRKGWKPRSNATKKKMSEKDIEMRRKAWYSVAFAAVSVVAYAVVGGYVSLDFGDEEDEEEEDDRAVSANLMHDDVDDDEDDE